MSALPWFARWRAGLSERLTSTTRADVLRYGLFLLACVPVFLALRMQLKHWVNIPIWDEWDTPGTTLLHFAQHKLSWADLFAQHNESRKFFPRLIYIAITWALGWDVRYGMVLTFLGVAVVSAFLLFRLRDSGKNSSTQILFAWLVINALLFGPWEYENFLSGNAFEIFLPVVALCGCVAVNLSDRSLGAKVLWNSLLATLATYSFAHGMIVWVLAVPISWSNGKRPADALRRSAPWYLLYALAGAIAITCYFWDYKRPDIFPPSATLLQAPLLVQFGIAWLGAVLKSDCTNSTVAGALAALVFFIACLLAAFGVRRHQRLWKVYYPWLLLAGFATASGLTTAVGRANLGINTVFFHGLDGFSSYRYNATAVLAYVAAAGLLFCLYSTWIKFQPAWRIRFLIAITVLVTLLGEAWLFSFVARKGLVTGLQDNRRRARTSVIWSKAIPDNPELFLAYPYPENFAERVAELKKVNLLRIPEISDELITAILRAPQTADPAAGSLEKGNLVDSDHLRVAGWARTPAQNRRADYIVLGWEEEDRSFRPFTAMPTGQRRSDLTEKFNSRALRNAGFTQEIDISNLPQRKLTLRAVSVDLDRQQAFPMQGSVSLDRSAEQK